MGGATSKFEQTDWSTASGGLVDGVASGDDPTSSYHGQERDGSSSQDGVGCRGWRQRTVDGTNPTSAYGVYTLTKCGSSWTLCPRDFDVSDDATHNLLYSTRSVVSASASSGPAPPPRFEDENEPQQQQQFPLGSFDVYLGRDAILADHNLTRRRSSRGGSGLGEEKGADLHSPPPPLLRVVPQDWTKGRWTVYRCCSTGNDNDNQPCFPGQVPDLVASAALSASLYGHENRKELSSSTLRPPPIVLYKSCCIVVSWTRSRAVAVPYGPPSSSPPPPSLPATTTAIAGQPSKTSGNEDEPSDDPGESISLLPVDTPSAPSPSERIGLGEDDRSGAFLSRSLRCEQQGALMWKDDGRTILVCQEVFDRILGSHQTSLAGPREVREMLRLEIGSAQLDDTDDQSTPNNSSNHSDSNSFSTDVGDITKEQASERAGDATGASYTEECDKECCIDRTTSNGPQMTLQTHERHSKLEQAKASGPQTPPKEEENQLQPQPLVGYWGWQPALRSHHMKMHLAKESDLVLHVVLAVILNQVRSERNALAVAI